MPKRIAPISELQIRNAKLQEKQVTLFGYSDKTDQIN